MAIIKPRVLEVYNNLGGGSDTINGFISTMLQTQQELEVTQKWGDKKGLAIARPLVFLSIRRD
nr:hypothetical protein BCV09_17465 [Vibrio cyclitrophicus]